MAKTFNFQLLKFSLCIYSCFNLQTYITIVKDVLKKFMNGFYKPNVDQSTNITQIIDGVQKGAQYAVNVKTIYSSPSETHYITVRKLFKEFNMWNFVTLIVVVNSLQDQQFLICSNIIES